VASRRKLDDERARFCQDLRPQFRLRPGQDDLLIERLTSFAPRRRSQAIRNALHCYLKGRKEHDRHADGRRWNEDPDLATALDTLF